MRITDSTVEYSRRIGDGAAHVTLNLTVDEDIPGAAIAWAHKLIEEAEHAAAVAMSPQPTMTATEVVARQKTGSYPPTDKVPAEAEENKAPPEFTAKVEAMKPAAADPFAITAKAVPQANPTSAPSASSEPTTAAPAVSPTTNAPPSQVSASAPTPDPVIDGLTDNDLHAAAQAAIEKKIPAQAVRDITAKYAGQQGMTISQIPADKRPLWLADVKKLYKP